MAQPFDDQQQAALAAVCDTFVPAVAPPAVEASDPTGFWARRASDLGVPDALADELERRLADDELDGLRTLLDLLARTGFARLPQAAREVVLAGLARTGEEAADGISGLRSLTLNLFYGDVDESGTNPNWAQSGYPGPPPTTSHDRGLTTWEPPAGSDELVLDADVVVVGSGSGGGVMAGVLAQAGLDVVVLEAGAPVQDPDFPADELPAFRDLYWRGGLTPTADGNVAILAGATLGGGSTINWQNCVAPPVAVRDHWADQYGLRDLATSTFDDHLDAVLERIGATADCTDLNGPNQRLAEGAKALGWSWEVIRRNTDPATYDPDSAGHVGYGDRSGSKQGTSKTYLRDAAASGARIVTRCRVQRVETAGGRATGVVGTVASEDGTSRDVRVRARDVVVACGALETPALLLRSDLGGPAAGRYLRLHPVPMLMGVYREPQRAWWGPPQAAMVDEHREAVAGHGYLVETAHNHPGLIGMSVPWRSGRDHKLLMGRASEMAAFIAVQRDHGHGQVTLDAAGEAEVTYPLVDEVDRAVTRHALRTMAQLHVAAGARAMVDLHPTREVWTRGQDVDGYADRIGGRSLGKGGRVLFCAHQMGSARMGTDPATSSTTPEGRLHDVDNVWIGDTSVFPTAVGSNPMLTCMAMARRTAHALLAARP